MKKSLMLISCFATMLASGTVNAATSIYAVSKFFDVSNGSANQDLLDTASNICLVAMACCYGQKFKYTITVVSWCIDVFICCAVRVVVVS